MRSTCLAGRRPRPARQEFVPSAKLTSGAHQPHHARDGGRERAPARPSAGSRGQKPAAQPRSGNRPARGSAPPARSESSWRGALRSGRAGRRRTARVGPLVGRVGVEPLRHGAGRHPQGLPARGRLDRLEVERLGGAGPYERGRAPRRLSPGTPRGAPFFGRRRGRAGRASSSASAQRSHASQ